MVHLSQEFIKAEAAQLPWGREPWPACSLLPVGDVEAQGGPQGEVGEEGAGHVLQLGVGPQGLEVLHVVPEVRRGERPVGHGWQLGVGVWREAHGSGAAPARGARGAVPDHLGSRLTRPTPQSPWLGAEEGSGARVVVSGPIAVSRVETPWWDVEASEGGTQRRPWPPGLESGCSALRWGV